MICLDSDWIIDFFRGKKEAIDALFKQADEIGTTEINSMEIYFGIYNKPHISEEEEQYADEFFASMRVLQFSESCGKRSAKIMASLVKSGKEIEPSDVQIGSILLHNGFSAILTRNTKHFSLIKGLKVISY